tara:strand:- start:920 stop:2509 length:1590 start_codon:yes stop_codon:yes gene_type:complete
MSINSLGYVSGKNPLAQSFFVPEATGLFLTKIGLYFKSTFTATANSQLPVSLHLRPMRDGVPIDTQIVPGSVVYKAYNEVNTSNDATAETQFVFNEPVYLSAFTDYAFCVYAESPEYEIWISQLDETIIGSASATVNRNPSIGSLFYSQNGATFTAEQTQDLKFRLYRAKFTTGVRKSANISNAKLPRELLVNDPVKTVAGSSDVSIFFPNHGLQVNNTVSLTGATATGGYTADSLNKNHTITGVDAISYKFAMGSSADSNAVGGGSLVQSTKNIPYSVLYTNMSMIKPTETDATFGLKATKGKSFAGASTSLYDKETEFTTIQLNKTLYADEAHIVAADSIADVEIAVGAKSLEINTSFLTENDFVSPMIDLQRCSMTLVDNVIDKQAATPTTGFNVPLTFVDETNARGGTSAAKHITKPITLESSAVGLKICITAHRPREADFDVYVRTTQAGGEDIRNKTYKLIDKEQLIPSDEDPRRYRQYNYLLGGPGGNFPAFTQFQIKIVMTSTNSAKVPVLKDLRAIALSA